MVSAAAITDDNPGLDLPFDLPAEIASLAPEVRAVELRRIADVLHTEADRLDGDVLLTTQQAATLAGRCEEAVRVWVREHGIGEYDPVAHRYLIRRSRLIEHVLRTQGVLPAGLRA
jgi:hypothetical protein